MKRKKRENTDKNYFILSTLILIIFLIIPINAESQNAENLRHYFDFEETGSFSVDLIGGGAIIFNTQDMRTENGFFGKGINFTNQNFIGETNFVMTHDALTIAFWMDRLGTEFNEIMILESEIHDGKIVIDHNLGVRITAYNNSGTQIGTIQQGTSGFALYSIRINTTEITLTINGIIQNTISINPAIHTFTLEQMRLRLETDNTITGTRTMDELMIFNKVEPLSNLVSIYNNGDGVPPMEWAIQSFSVSFIDAVPPLPLKLGEWHMIRLDLELINQPFGTTTIYFNGDLQVRDTFTKQLITNYSFFVEESGVYPIILEYRVPINFNKNFADLILDVYNTQSIPHTHISTALLSFLVTSEPLEQFPPIITQNLPHSITLLIGEETILGMNDYFENYNEIRIFIRDEETIPTTHTFIETSLIGITQSYNTNWVNISLIPDGNNIILFIENFNSTKTIKLQTEAKNNFASTDLQTTYLSMNGSAFPQPVIETSPLGKGVSFLEKLFPPHQNLNTSQKFGFVFVSMLGVTLIFIGIGVLVDNKLIGVMAYISVIINIFLFFFFLSIKYIPIGVFVFIVLGVIGMAYFSLFKPNNAGG
jgi:hypothetical protein